jgi:nucleoside-diphosphate-sugar epimerase
MPLALVTGATGYVASELVHQLLAAGWTVRGTVRDPADAARTAHLTALAAALPGDLELVAADLLTDGAFDAAVQSVDAVFHVASPFFIKADDPQRELIQPAVAGTANVLKSVARAGPRPPRVVLTSSVAAVHGEYATPPVNGDLYTDADWNESSTVDTQPYHASKALAEREAWKLAESLGLDLRVICPNFVLGPVLSRESRGTSLGYMKAMVEGGPVAGTPIICDVRDVALAHVRAATIDAASGRYIVSHAGAVTPDVTAAALKKALPPGAAVGDVAAVAADAARPRIDASRTAAELGVALRPVEETIGDMARSLVALGIAQVKKE